MRQDIRDLIKNRPIWILSQDEEYRVRLEAYEYAKKKHSINEETVIELRDLLEARRRELLG